MSGDALGAGEARFFCILIDVAIGTTFMLILNSRSVDDFSERLMKKIARSEAPGR